jgi:hypothetical protein
MEVRSYRRVFDLERRIYRIDRLRLNPAGVPVSGIAYFLIALATVVVLSHLPLIATAAGVLPWYVRDLGVPAGGAALLAVIRVEGRPFHLAARALLRHAVGPRCLARLRGCAVAGELWQPQDVVMLPDGSDSRMRRIRYEGPGAVMIGLEHERAVRVRHRFPRMRLGVGAAVILRERPGARRLSGRVAITFAPGAIVVVQPARGRRR